MKWIKIKKLTDQLVFDYRIHPIVKDHCSCRLPSNREIKEIIKLSKEVLFPGFFSKRNVSETGHWLSTFLVTKRLHRKLKREISLALLYLADESRDKNIAKKSCTLCVDFIASLPQIRAQLHTDLEAHYLGDPAAFNRDQIIVSYPGFYAIVIYRMAHRLHQLGVPLIPRMMAEFAHRETGIDINPGAEIGDYFFIDHGTGVVIGETAVVGNHVKIYQGVTLGALSTRGGQFLKGVKRHPTIGDNVTIYAGASILGGSTVVGDHATIGSNAFLTESVPAGARVSIAKQEQTIRIASERSSQNVV